MAVNRTNMYDIAEDWITNIAPKYFDLSDISLNRVGLFGYVNEIESAAVESIVNENSILYNELFFKRAVLPQSIYAYASHYNVADTMANASVMSFSLVISEQTVLDNALSGTKYAYFMIDSDSTITIEDNYVFSLDYDIKINIRKDKAGNYSYSARYVTDGLDNPLSTIKNGTNPYIKITKLKFNDTYYLVLYVDCHQVYKTETNKTIYTEDFIEYFTFDIDSNSDDQIADFSVFYKAPTDTEYTQIDKILIDAAAQDEPFCYYQYKDDNKVNISFSTISRYFRPEYNSSLKFVFYNTKGASGAFQYTGSNIVVNLKSSIYDYSTVVMRAMNISDSVGGKDKETFDEIKEDVATMASTAFILGTSNDLNSYFQKIEMNSDVRFYKKEDDYKTRMFGCFSKFTDSKDNVVPSNTCDIDLYDEDFDLIEESTKRYVIKAGNKFIYKPNEYTLKKMGDQGSLLFDPKFIYKNPFTWIVNRENFSIEYYNTSINKTYTPDFNLVNDDVYINFIMNDISITRNALVSDEYVISFSVFPSIENLETIFCEYDSETNTFIKDNGSLIVKGMIYNEDEKMTHYFTANIINADITTSKTTYYFEARIKTDDYISKVNGLRTLSGITDVDKPERENPLILATELDIRLGLFIQNEEIVDNVDEYHEKIPELKGYELTNLYTIDETVSLFTNMNRFMYSTVLYKRDEDRQVYYKVREVPVIKSEYLDINEYAEEFYKAFSSDYLVLKENLARVTNAFDTSIKLYNTYGKSRYFYVNEKTTNTLDQVNLILSFKIKLNPNKSADELLKEEIRTYIVNYVDSINKDDDLNFYISNVITEIESDFTDIIYTKFNYINDYNVSVQSIEKNFPTSEYDNNSVLVEYVPEYLNMNKTYISYGTSETNILIDFV